MARTLFRSTLLVVGVAIGSVAIHAHGDIGLVGQVVLDQESIGDLEVADFNEDGHEDLLVITGSQVELFPGTGTGGFEPRSLAMSGRFFDLAVDDFDGDGHLDFVASRWEDDTIAVCLGDGRGNFALLIDEPSGGDLPDTIEIADFNGDGDLDLAVLHRTSEEISILLGDGAGRFAVSTTAVVGRDRGELRAADFDENGHVDIAFASETPSDVLIILADGAGSFLPPSIVDVNGCPESIDIGDFDENGHVDIVVSSDCHSSQEGGTLLLGDGLGGFAASDIETGGFENEIRVVDIDSDGHLDLVATGSSLKVGFGTGAGTFSFAAPISIPPDGKYTRIADFNEDGNLDVLTHAGGTSTEIPRAFRLVMTDGAGAELGRPASIERGGRDHALADFDGDGEPELAVLRPNEVQILRLDGALGLELLTAVPTPANTRAMTTGDLNADGAPDLVVAYSTGVQAFLGAGDATTFTPTTPVSGLANPVDLVVGNFDDESNDFADVAVAERNSFAITLLEGDGTGELTLALRCGLDAPATAVAADDLDGDGHLDVVAGRESRSTRVCYGSGFGAFPATLDLTVSDAGTVLIEDMDGDGTLDIISASEPSIWVLFGDGGGFPTRVAAFTGLSIRNPVCADLNEDGTLDLVTTAKVGDDSRVDAYKVAIIEGLGDRSFHDSLSVATLFLPVTVGIADFDGDGHSDVASISNQDLRLYSNRTFDPQRCRRGNVNQMETAPVDVLHVNGSSGSVERQIALTPADPLEIFMDAAPSGGTKFALYAWLGSPTFASGRQLPFDTGILCRPMLLTDANPPGLRKVWNNIGKTSVLGIPDLPSAPAPSLVLSLPNGIGREVEIFLQGILLDPAAPNGLAAVTNGVGLSVHP